MESIKRGSDGASNRATGIVDQNVHRAVIGNDLVDNLVAGIQIRQVTDIVMCCTTRFLDGLLSNLQTFFLPFLMTVTSTESSFRVSRARVETSFMRSA